MPTATASAESVELLPGYYIEERTGAWLTLPWPGDRSLPFNHPKRKRLLPPTLGLQVASWCEANLVHHLSGEPWRFTNAQLRFLILWYALREDGKWLYRSGVKRGAKGTGKDPLGAALAIAETCGPVLLDDWSKKTGPVGRPHRLALVQIAANAEAQAKDLLRVANAMISDRLKESIRVDDGETRTIMGRSSRIELLTRSEATNEGDPATAILLNESHHMTATSGGQALAGVARRNVAKSPGGIARLLELTNAHMPGDAAVAEESFDAWQLQVSGRAPREDILYDSREAAPALRLHVPEELEVGIAQAYADAPWVDQERIRDEAQDPRVPLADSVRYYFNALPTNELAWVDPRAFDSLALPSEIVVDREPIAMFLDCSKSHDATVISASRIVDGFVMALGGWQRPHGDRGTGWLAPREEVDAVVRAAFDRYEVLWFGVDPSPARDDETEAQYWAELIDGWHREYRDKLVLWATPGAQGSSVLFDMRLSAKGGAERNRLFTEEAERTAAAIDDDGTLHWDGDPMMRVHVHNARRRPNQWGMTLGKQSRSSSKLVDYAVTMVGARLGRRLVLNSGKQSKKQRSGRVY